MRRNNNNRRLLALALLTTVVTLYWIVVGEQGSPDQLSYITAWKNFSSGVIDMERTPVYPCIIGLAKWLGGDTHMATVIILMQNIVACAAVFYAYRIALRATSSTGAAFWIAAAIAFIPDLVAWRNSIMTESLAMSGSIFLIYNTIAIYDGRSKWNPLWFSFWLFFLVYLRPSFVYMLPALVVAFALMIWQKRELWRRSAAGLVVIGAVAVSLFFYCSAFHRAYGIFAPTSIALENEFYDMRQSGDLDPSKAANKQLGEFIAQTYKDNGTKLYQYVYCPILWHDLDYVLKHWSLTDMQQFVEASRTPTNVLSGIATRTYYASRDVMVYPRPKSLFEAFNFTIGWVYLMLAIYAVLLYRQWKRDKSIPWVNLFLFLLSTLNLITAILGAFGQNVGEWGRLIYPSKFMYIIMTVQIVQALIYRIKGGKL